MQAMVAAVSQGREAAQAFLKKYPHMREALITLQKTLLAATSRKQ